MADGKHKDHSLDEAVELTGHGCYNYLVLAACCIIINACAVDMFSFSVVVTAANCDLKLGISETAILTSIPLAGIVLAYPWGYYADVRGRRQALLVSSWGGFIMAALSAFSPSWQVMLGLKLIASVFSTAAYTVTMPYLGENTGGNRMNSYMFLLNSANLAAEILFYVLALFILPLGFKLAIPWLSITFRSWRLYTLVLAVPMGLGALMLLFLKESPKFLASVGESDEALKVLNVMYECNGGKKGEYPVKVLKCKDLTDNCKESFWKSAANQTFPLFQPPFIWRTLQLFFLMAMCCCTNNVFLMWYPMMVNVFFNSYATGVMDGRSFCHRIVANITSSTYSEEYACIDTISPNTIYSGITLGTLFVSLNLAASFVAKWRKMVLLVVFLVSGVCLVLTDLVRDPIANLVIFTLIQCTGIGMGCVAAYFVDLYPTNYRGMVTSLCMMVSRLASLAGVNAVGASIVDYCEATFYFWAGLVVCAMVAVMFLPGAEKKKIVYD